MGLFYKVFTGIGEKLILARGYVASNLEIFILVWLLALMIFIYYENYKMDRRRKRKC